MNQPAQRSHEWHQQRLGRVTGSIVGAILGESPYMTRDQAMRSMVRAYHGAESEFTGNIATEYGTNHEDGAKWQYEMEIGNTVEPAYFVTYEDWLGASPDGYIGETGLLEIKCPYGKRNGGEFKSIAEQPHYYSQIQIQLLCTDRDWCDFYQWSPHGTKKERVLSDKTWYDKNLPILRQFYAEYLHEVQNPDEHLEPLRKEINTEAACKLIAEYDDLAQAIDNANERKKEVMAELVTLSGGQNALIDGRKFTKVSKEGNVSYAAVVKKHCAGVDLEPFRGKPSEYWLLT